MLKYIKETVKNSAIYSVGNISVKLVGFILVPLLTDPEYLSVEAYGALGVLEAVNQILVSLLGLGLYNSLFRWYYDQSEDENKKTFFTSGLVVLILVSVTGIIAFMYRDSIANLIGLDTSFSFVVALMILATGLQALAQFPATLMRLQDKASFFTYTNILKLAVTLAVTLYFLIVEQAGLAAVYYGQIAGFVVFLILVSPYMARNSRAAIQWTLFTEMMGYGLSLMVAGLAGAAINVIDRFVLNSMSGLEEVGLYSLGYKVASILKVFVIASVSMSVIPMIFRKMKDPDRHRFYQKTMTYYGFGMMICIMGVSLFSKEVIKVFTGSTMYWSSFTVIPILAFGLFFTALKDVVVTGLHITKKTGWISFMTTIVSVLNLSLNILLIPVLGAEGAALASLFSQFAYFVGLFYFSNRVYPIRFEWRKIIMIYTTGVVLVYLALLTNDLHLWVRLVTKSGALLLFPLVLYPMNFYEKAELEQLRIIWQNWRNPANWRENVKRLF